MEPGEDHSLCGACHRSYDLSEPVWRCGCGGLLELPLIVDRPFVVDDAVGSLWRYRAMLGSATAGLPAAVVTMGEGMTPLIDESPGVALKLDFLMPTLSFKDRGSTVLITHAARLGVTRLVADSSGNAGASLAAYAARAGMAVEVFVPSATSPKKVSQLQAYGAEVRQIVGSRQQTAAAAIDRVESGGAFYASHVFNPWFHQGTKTFAFELWEQMGGRLPGTVVLPAGNGTLLLGAAIGFAELVAAGRAVRLPRLVAVQSARCAPLFDAWAGGRGPGAPGNGGRGRIVSASGTPGPEAVTAAEGIAIAQPARLAQMLAAVRSADGVVIKVEEEAIIQARRALLARGIDVEPTAAVAWAAWTGWSEAETTPGPVVVALSGAGLKAPS